jgi:phospholipid-translocating ATPase
MWANTILASSGYILGIVMYTGIETRSQMNQQQPTTKIGKLELELNNISKYLFVIMLILSLSIVALNGFRGAWEIQYFRFVLLLSSIIPISLRVNLDLARMYYSYIIY